MDSLTDIRALDGLVAQDTSEKVTELGIANSSSVKLPRRTVCFSRTASVGFVTVMGREDGDLPRLRELGCGPDLDSIYLMHALITSRDLLRSLSSGSIHQTIYFPTVEDFRVLIPPLAQKFATLVTRFERHRTRLREAERQADHLFQRLLADAFDSP